MDGLVGRNGRPLKVLHVLAVSVPHVNGYTIRSKYIIDTQREEGLDPLVVTSPYYQRNEASKTDATIAGTNYFRVPHPMDTTERDLTRVLFRGVNKAQRILKRVKYYGSYLARRASPSVEATPPTKPAEQTKASPLYQKSLDYIWTLGNKLLMKRFEEGISRVVERERPDLIHAHSPFRCGLPALHVARQYKIPFIYEVRGMWEESAVASKGEDTRNTLFYQVWRDAETAVMKEADGLVCICEQLRQEAISRGVAPERIVVVPNAVDSDSFQPPGEGVAVPEKVTEVRKQLRGLTLGYIGSLRKLEGVDELVRGAAEMMRRGRDISLLIVGSGDNINELKELSQSLGLGERAIFTGRVPHEEVAFYYEMIDAFVISRPDLRVTRMVTPLKPLEAMAMQRPVVVSDLPALRELVQEGRTGLLYRPGDIEDLATQCARLQDEPALRASLSEEARRWVLAERTWPKVLQRLSPIYEALARRST